jgi:hypothetical protein
MPRVARRPTLSDIGALLVFEENLRLTAEKLEELGAEARSAAFRLDEKRPYPQRNGDI